MAKPRFVNLEAEYKRLWEGMTVRKSWRTAIDRRARAILANKRRYLQVEDQTGVPWWWVGCVHSMESGLSFRTHLHNGDSLKRRTYHVPKGRPKGSPPFTWEASAKDALLMKRLDVVAEWPIERCLYEWENFNGWGYRKYHSRTLSPYLWSSSTHYRSGKYIADGKWSSSAVSGQTGAVPLLKRLTELDPAITFGETVAEKTPAPAKAPEPIPLPPVPVQKPVVPAEPIMAPKEIIAKSRKLTLLQRIRKFIEFIFTSIASLFTLEHFGFAKGIVTDVQEIAFGYSIWIILGLGLGVWVGSKYLTDLSVEDQEAGRYVPSRAG